MSVEVVEKRKGGVTCGDCGASLAAGATKCAECDSENIKKSLVVVRKAVGDDDEEVKAALENDSVEEEDDLEEEEDELDDDEDDEEDEEETDDDEEDEEVPEPVAVGKLLSLEALNIMTAGAEDVIKVFAENPTKDAYEEVMVELNNVMDAAAERWFKGETVTKADQGSGHAALVRERVNGIINKEGKKMPRPKNFDSLDDETKKYIEDLEKTGEGEDGVVKSAITKRDDLPEDVRKSLEAADKIVEENETKKWDELAKSYTHFPGDKQELAKSLRKLSETDEEAFKVMKNTLDAAQENLRQSDIFKSYGLPGNGNSNDDENTAQAKELVAKGEYKTIEQAQVALMDGRAYKPTNV
jgi:ribosomal protein L40E